MSADISEPSKVFLGIKTKVEIGVVPVATSAGRLVTNRPNRIALQVSNVSASAVTISPLRSISTTEGIRLGVTGGFYSINIIEDGNLPALEWFSIGAGAVNVLVIEVLRL